jgi:transcriptional regulator
MYIPHHFEETRVEELHRIINDHPLATFVIDGPNGLDANHLPFLLDAARGEQGHLLAHVARSNSVWTDVKDGDDVLVIFRAADAYISPAWYPSTRESHRQVPTWNYQVVHVHGKVKVCDDKNFVRGVVARLTAVHEGRTGSSKPWTMTDSSTEFIDQMLAAVVGIEIAITRMVGKWKLGQNREDRDRIGAAEELRKRGEQGISTAMLNVSPRSVK